MHLCRKNFIFFLLLHCIIVSCLRYNRHPRSRVCHMQLNALCFVTTHGFFSSFHFCIELYCLVIHAQQVSKFVSNYHCVDEFQQYFWLAIQFTRENLPISSHVFLVVIVSQLPITMRCICTDVTIHSSKSDRIDFVSLFKSEYRLSALNSKLEEHGTVV